MSHEGIISGVSHERFTVPKKGLANGTLFIEVNASSLSGDKDKIKIAIYSGENLIETTTTTFLGPRSYR